MSIENNKDIVRRYQDAYNTANYEALAEVVAADVRAGGSISRQSTLCASPAEKSWSTGVKKME